jgi:hypothetical protein
MAVDLPPLAAGHDRVCADSYNRVDPHLNQWIGAAREPQGLEIVECVGLQEKKLKRPQGGTLSMVSIRNNGGMDA